MPFSGIFGEAGLVKESAAGTWEAPKRFMRFIPPFDFNTDKSPIISQAIRGVASMNTKWQEGPALLKSGKIKFEIEPEGGIGDHLMASFGTDTPAEVASFVVTAHTPFVVTLNTNDFIDFTEDGGGAVAAQLTAGTYTANKLCAEIKTQMEAVNGASTYTVTFSITAKKFTITKSAGVFVILWNSGTNNAKAADTLLGFAADTASTIAQTSATALTYTAANDALDFTEDGGGEVTVFLTAGTYKMGASSADAGSLCKLIKDVVEAGNGTGATYTVTYSTATKKLTITKNSGVFVLMITTGANANIGAGALLGFLADSASAIAAVSDDTTGDSAWSHAFTRIASATLPSYSWWQKNGAGYQNHAGCMLNKLDIDIKKGEFLIADADWTGLKFDPTGAAQSPDYSELNPFKFNQAVLTIGGSLNVDTEDLKISINNNVGIEHVVGNTIYASKAASHGLAVSISGSFIIEDTTEWDKFIAGESTSFLATITGAQLVNGAVYHSLVVNIPLAYYRAAPIPVQTGFIRIAFSADAILDPVTGHTITATLVNSEASAH